MANLPAESVFTEFGNLSYETIAARLRDAINAYAENNWSPVSFDAGKFDQFKAGLHIANTGTYVRVWHGSRTKVERQAANGAYVVQNPTNGDVEAFYYLVAHRHFPQGLMISCATNARAFEVHELCIHLGDKNPNLDIGVAMAFPTSVILL